MFFHAILVHAFFILIPVKSLLQVQTKNDRSFTIPNIHEADIPWPNETVIGVIKNISKVNEALQELIKNYEHLQKIYKTESIETGDDYSSDAEIDERYKDRKQKKKSRSKMEIVSYAPRFPATQLAFEDSIEKSKLDETNEDEESASESKDEKNTNRLPNIEHLVAPKHPNGNEIEDNKSDSDTSDDRFTSKNVAVGKETTHKMPEIIFIHQKSSQVPYVMTTQPKTRYKKIAHRGDLRAGVDNDFVMSINVNSQLKNNNSSKNVQNLYDLARIFQNTSTLLKDDPHFRSKDEKTNGTVKNERSKIYKNDTRTKSETFAKAGLKSSLRNGGTDQKQKKSDSGSDEEEREINKDMFKTQILRKAYGDACSKVVVKKCHKACKKASKLACSTTGCKSSFKESFNSKAKAGCVKEFVKDSAKPAQRIGQIAINKDDFFAAACWPLMRRSEQLNLPKLTNMSTLRTDVQLNILRDRYEKACAAASAKKCESACLYAFGETCKKTECQKKLKKTFKKRCKTECRNAYRTSKRASGGSSTSDSSSDSDSS